MPTLQFTLRVISPAFVAGATPYRIQDPDIQISIHSDALRIPSLKGVLRFWFRTLFAYRPPEFIKTYEERVFGSTQAGQGFRLRLIGVANARYGNVETTYRNQFKYLGYGPFGDRKAILPGATFRFVATGDPEQLTALKTTLRLLHLFGGIGARSRRGWGSLAVSESSEPILLPYTNRHSVKTWVETNLNSVFDQSIWAQIEDQLPLFSAFSPHHRIRITAPEPIDSDNQNYQKILKKFYDAFRAVRHYQGDSYGRIDHDQEYGDYENQEFSTIPFRMAFGFPFNVGSRTTDMGIRYVAHFNDKDIDRRASPLILKVLEGPDNNLYGLALFLKSHFFPQEAIITAQYRSYRGELPRYDRYSPMEGEAFFDSFDPERWAAVEEFLQHRILRE